MTGPPLLQRFRDELVRDLYRDHYPRLSRRAAAAAISRDLAVFRRRWLPRVASVARIEPFPTEMIDTYYMLAINPAPLPGLRSLRRILSVEMANASARRSPHDAGRNPQQPRSDRTARN